jgi:hypothetical protein
MEDPHATEALEQMYGEANEGSFKTTQDGHKIYLGK